MAIRLDSLRLTKEWHRGREGEKYIAQCLREAGWYILPAYEYSGNEDEKAPRLQGLDNSFIIPDFLIARNGEVFWVEAKVKSQPTYTRLTERQEHGIPLRHYHDYLKVQEITGIQVWLFIYEESSQQLLYSRLNELIPDGREYYGNKMSYGGMVFFPRDAFKLWDGEVTTLLPEELEALYDDAYFEAMELKKKFP